MPKIVTIPVSLKDELLTILRPNALTNIGICQIYLADLDKTPCVIG
jgi:hypothetical protein